MVFSSNENVLSVEISEKRSIEVRENTDDIFSNDQQQPYGRKPTINR
jgi:hypothetical protein